LPAGLRSGGVFLDGRRRRIAARGFAAIGSGDRDPTAEVPAVTVRRLFEATDQQEQHFICRNIYHI
jgi:hypothetical protein